MYSTLIAMYCIFFIVEWRENMIDNIKNEVRIDI